MNKLKQTSARVKVAKKSHKKSLAGSQALSMGDVVAPGGTEDNAGPKGLRQDGRDATPGGIRKSKLEPCAHCGAAAMLHTHIDETDSLCASVACILCGISTPLCRDGDVDALARHGHPLCQQLARDSLGEARSSVHIVVAMWNRRVFLCVADKESRRV